MSKYSVYGQVTGSKYLGEVEAETEEEAIKKGEGLDDCWISLCHQCSDEIEDPQVIEISAIEQ